MIKYRILKPSRKRIQFIGYDDLATHHLVCLGTTKLDHIWTFWCLYAVWPIKALTLVFHFLYHYHFTTAITVTTTIAINNKFLSYLQLHNSKINLHYYHYMLHTTITV